MMGFHGCAKAFPCLGRIKILNAIEAFQACLHLLLAGSMNVDAPGAEPADAASREIVHPHHPTVPKDLDQTISSDLFHFVRNSIHVEASKRFRAARWLLVKPSIRSLGQSATSCNALLAYSERYYLGQTERFSVAFQYG